MLSTENMAHPEWWPFAQATIHLQKRQQNKHLFAFGQPKCRTKSGTGLVSLSKLLPHLTQACDISHYLGPWTHQPGLPAALWTPSLLTSSLQPKAWSLWIQLCSLLYFSSVNPPACPKKPTRCWATTGRVLMAEDIVLPPNKTLWCSLQSYFLKPGRSVMPLESTQRRESKMLRLAEQQV